MAEASVRAFPAIMRLGSHKGDWIFVVPPLLAFPFSINEGRTGCMHPRALVVKDKDCNSIVRACAFLSGSFLVLQGLTYKNKISRCFEAHSQPTQIWRTHSMHPCRQKFIYAQKSSHQVWFLVFGAFALFWLVATSNARADRISNPVASFAGLDKITGRIISFDVAIGESVQFGTLVVTPRVCYTKPATETPQTTGFVDVDELPAGATELRHVFSGYMFAASPGIHGVEHPVYDVWLTDCHGGTVVEKTEPEADLDQATSSPAKLGLAPAPSTGAKDALKDVAKEADAKEAEAKAAALKLRRADQKGQGAGQATGSVAGVAVGAGQGAAGAVAASPLAPLPVAPVAGVSPAALPPTYLPPALGVLSRLPAPNRPHTLSAQDGAPANLSNNPSVNAETNGRSNQRPNPPGTVPVLLPDLGNDGLVRPPAEVP